MPPGTHERSCLPPDPKALFSISQYQYVKHDPSGGEPTGGRMVGPAPPEIAGGRAVVEPTWKRP